MTEFKLTKERKIILIVGGILLLAGFIYRVSPTIYSYTSLSEEIALEQKKLEKLNRIAAMHKTFEETRNRLDKTLQQAEFGLLSGKTTDLAAVDIQDMINDMAKLSNIEIKSLRVLNPQVIKDSPYTKILVEMNIDSDIKQLKEFIYKIETSKKYLKVDKLRIALHENKQGSEIKADLTLIGMMKKI